MLAVNSYSIARFSRLVAVVAVTLVSTRVASQDFTNVDLDANASVPESRCELNVLRTFPPKIENRVVNKAEGYAYTFSWKSAGPGGFSSSVPAGTAGGVGAVWTWTTDEVVSAFTGNSCANDVCFTQTGTSTLPKRCSLACLEDGIVAAVRKGTSASQIVLSWSASTGPFTVYRSTNARTVTDPANALTTAYIQSYTDVPPAGTIFYYRVRGPGCLTPKACTTDADCTPATEGTCVSRGPFSVPGRSLTSTEVTLSAGSLTSQMITFFSPGTQVLYLESSVAPGGAYTQTMTNTSGQEVTVAVADPPGCCPEPFQVNCDGQCFNYRTDPNNCGGCDIVCGEGEYCGEGRCLPSCAEGTSPCGASCVDLENDPNNCGVCGQVCFSGICPGEGCFQEFICAASECVRCDPPADHACGNVCTDVTVDLANCGACGFDCDSFCANGSGLNFCSEGACVCLSGPGFAAAAARQPTEGSIEAPICVTPPQVIPPNGTIAECQVSPYLAKEIATTAVVCGNGIPDGEARCPNGDPASQGTFMKLVPDPDKPIGAAYITPYAVHVTDSRNDGLIQPGETDDLLIDVLNAGPTTISNASATILSPPIDLTNDGVDNPVEVTLPTEAQSFGNILGTVGGTCSAPAPIRPSTNANPFRVTVPANHPSNTARPFTLRFSGTVAGADFHQDVPIVLGIADTCSASAGTRDYDEIEGLLPPMAKLVPQEDPVHFPDHDFEAGSTRPLKLRLSCGGVRLTGSDVDAPKLVGLSRVGGGGGDEDLTTVVVDPYFQYDVASGHWIYNLRTSELGTGRFVVTIQIAGRKEYVTGFVLRDDLASN